MGAILLDAIVEDAKVYHVQDAEVALQLDYRGPAHVLMADYSTKGVISSKYDFKVPLFEEVTDNRLLMTLAVKLINAVLLSRPPRITMGSHADIDVRDELCKADGRGWNLPMMMVADPLVKLPRWVQVDTAPDLLEGWLIGLAKLLTSKPVVCVRTDDGRMGLIARSTHIAGVKVLP